MKYDFKRMVALLSAFSGTFLFGASPFPVFAQTTPENAQRPYTCEELQQPKEALTYKAPAGVTAREQDAMANDVLRLYQRGKVQARITDFDVYEATFGRKAVSGEAAGAQAPVRTSTITHEYEGR